MVTEVFTKVITKAVLVPVWADYIGVPFSQAISVRFIKRQ